MLASLLKDGFWLAALRLGGAGLSFVTTLLLTRVLDLSEFGSYAYALALIMLAQVFITNGWGTMVLKSASRSHYSTDWQETASMASLGSKLALIYTILLCAFTYLLSFVPAEYLPIKLTVLGTVAVLFSILISQLSAIRISILRGLDRPVLSQLSEPIVRPILFCLLVAITTFWISDITVEVALVSYALATLASYLFGLKLLKISAPQQLKEAKVVSRNREWITQSLPFVGSSTITVAMIYVDIFLLGFFSSLEEIGQYRMAGQIAILAGLAYNALNMIANQRFAYFHQAKDRHNLAVTAKTLSRISFAVSIILPTIFYFEGELIIEWIFGPQYLPSYGPMMILFAIPLISGLFGMPRGLLLMSGEQNREFYLSIGAIVLNIVLCLILIPLFGINGAATGVVLATLIWKIAIWQQAIVHVGIDTSIFGIFGRKFEQ